MKKVCLSVSLGFIVCTFGDLTRGDDPYAPPAVESLQETPFRGGFIVACSDGGWLLRLDDGLVKVTASGSVGPTRLVPPGQDFAGRPRATQDGGAVFAGRMPDPSNTLWITKVDASGEVEWSRTEWVEHLYGPRSIVQTTAGQYMVIVGTYATGNPDDEWRHFVLPLGADGTPGSHVAADPLNGSSLHPTSVAPTDDGGIVLLKLVNLEEPVLLIKLGATGAIEWSRNLGIGIPWTSIMPLKSGGYMLRWSGMFRWIDDQGNTVRDGGFSSLDVVQDVILLSDEGLLVFGYAYDGNANPSERNSWVFRTNAESDILWRYHSPTRLRSVQATADGGFALLGFTPPRKIINLATDPVIAPPPSQPFVRGDANADGKLNLTDPAFTLGHLFLGGASPDCLEAADADDSGVLDLGDVVFFLAHLFQGGPAPTMPFPECGVDSSVDTLTCSSFLGCP